MKCEQCSCPMRLSSTVCSTASCSFQYVCDLCGKQRLTSELLSPGNTATAAWPDKSGYKPVTNTSENSQARHILDGCDDGGNERGNYGDGLGLGKAPYGTLRNSPAKQPRALAQERADDGESNRSQLALEFESLGQQPGLPVEYSSEFTYAPARYDQERSRHPDALALFDEID